MQRHRRFQPLVDGLPYRIAPSSVAAMVLAVTSGPVSSSSPGMMAADTDMTQGGSSSGIIVAPPGGGDGGLC